MPVPLLWSFIARCCSLLDNMEKDCPHEPLSWTPLLITFGSNLNPLSHLYQGLSALHAQIGIVAISTVFRTQAWEGLPVPDYLNGAVLCAHPLPPLQLKSLLRHIEAQCHRRRNNDRHAPRTLDLDIALMGSAIINTKWLRIPDPDIVKRPFIALPLAELAGNYLHPVEKISLATIRQQFPSQPTGMQPDWDATRQLQTIPLTTF